ncbi:hypothetical protein Tco_1097882 [Tanacetum coccineum]
MKELRIAFEKLMHENFQMSSMGELTFFLGLQVKQKKDGTFISQDKYVLKSRTKISLWYPKDSYLLSLVAYTDSRIILWDAKLEIRQALTINPTIYISCIEIFWSTVKFKTINGEAQLHALVDGKKIIVTESSVRRDLQLADEEDDAVCKELGDSLETPNESSSLGTTLGGGLRCQETIGDTIAQTRFENVSKVSNDSLLTRSNTLQSDEDRLKLNELMELCTSLQQRVLDLEKTETTQGNEIASLKRRVKKLEKKNRSRSHKLKRLYKVGLTARVESFGDEQSLGEDASK